MDVLISKNISTLVNIRSKVCKLTWFSLKVGPAIFKRQAPPRVLARCFVTKYVTCVHKVTLEKLVVGRKKGD